MNVYREATLRLQKAIGPTSDPVRLDDLIELAMVDIVGLVDAPDAAQRYSARLRQFFDEEYKRHSDEQMDCWFAFNSRSHEFVQGPYFVEPSDSPSTRLAKENRIQVSEIGEALKSISFQEFESLSAAILGLLGAHNVRVTRPSNDQGLDFFGRLAIANIVARDFPFFNFHHSLVLWLVGQAKHYPGGTVGAPEVRSLVGSINLARFKEYAMVDSTLAELSIRSCDPVFSLVFTTGAFSRDAKKLAKASGVVLLDLGATSKFLADNGLRVDPGLPEPSHIQLMQWVGAILQRATVTMPPTPLSVVIP